MKKKEIQLVFTAIAAAVEAKLPWASDKTLLDYAVAGHCGKEALGSVFVDNCGDATNADETAVAISRLDEADDLEVVADEESVTERKTSRLITLRRASCPCTGRVRALPLEAFDAGTMFRVEALGDHPALIAAGDYIVDEVPTDVVTFVLEVAGPEYEEDRAMFELGAGYPVLATVHPGRPLPPSNPYDCQVGDIMSRDEAIAKGWAVVKASKEVAE